MTDPIKFRAPPGETIRLVTLDGGHTAVITDEPRELPERFHRQAVASGALTSNMIQAPAPPPPQDDSPDLTHEELIRRALIQMVERNEEADFTAAGQPNLNIARGLAGINADRDLIYKVFAEMKAEADKADAEKAATE